jgi:hypothetical protein
VGLLNVQSRHQPGQFFFPDFHDLFMGAGPFKTVFFKPFLPDTEPVLVPIQDLQDGFVPVAKNEQMA